MSFVGVTLLLLALRSRVRARPSHDSAACGLALSALSEAACELASTAMRPDYCSATLPCIVIANRSKWPAKALLGSQLTRRLDVIKAAHAQGCAAGHADLAEPAVWAEHTFNLGKCSSAAVATSAAVSTSALPTPGSAVWRHAGARPGGRGRQTSTRPRSARWWRCCLRGATHRRG